MLRVFICEDNLEHKNQIQKCVENCIMIHNLDMKVSLSTVNPDEIIEYLNKERVFGLYFLDVNLKHKITGVQLAEVIRKYDPRGFIVFITTHDEAMPLTFKHKVEALDFISKDDFCDIPERIYGCILDAHSKYTSTTGESQKKFSFKDNDKLITIEYSKIYFFETSLNAKHKIFVHTEDSVHEFYESLRELLKDLDKSFYRCHKSYIINTNQEIKLDRNEKMVYFKDGSKCLVSGRKMRQLIEILHKKEHVIN